MRTPLPAFIAAPFIFACATVTAQDPQQPAPLAPAPQSQPAAAHTAPNPPGAESGTPAATEDQLRQQLQGKTFYLRGGYLENSLHFNDRGALDGNSPQASYTLSLVEITRVHADKKHVELEGVRYGLHFLGLLASEDQSAAVDKVRLTSKKKPLKIVIDREEVVKPKKEKEPRPSKAKKGPAALQPAPAAAPAQPVAEPGRRGVTVTISQAHANHALTLALDHIFSPGIDDKMIATLPDYWKLYYQSVAARQDYRPSDPSVLRQGQVDQKAKLTSVFEPPSNEYAQNNGVAGMAMYHVVVGVDGNAGEIAIGRPIGFGLDESAVAAIRKASFQPAAKDGKPVPVELDLVVQFRIYSKRTAVASNQAPASTPVQPNAPTLPGPYTANQPRQQPAAQPQDQPPPQPSPQPAAQPSNPPAPQPKA